jgi:sulfate transport system permease protein
VQTPFKRRSVLPGFWPTFGCSVLYLSLVVLIPLSAVFLKSVSSSWTHLWNVISAPNVTASYRLSFGASLVAGLLSAGIGFLVAWVLVRYPFPAKALADALVDLPFALPTAVAGIALTSLYTENGWLGRYLAPLGIKVAFTRLGVVVALTFIGLPFVVRSVQPVLADADRELEEAASSLGATRWQIFSRVIFPIVRPSLLTGFALAFARAHWVSTAPYFYLRQPPHEDGNCSAADCHQAGTIRLRGSHGHRGGHADCFVPASAGSQRTPAAR